MHVKPPGFDPLPTLPTPEPGSVPGRGSAGLVGRPDGWVPTPVVTPRLAPSPSPAGSALQDAALPDAAAAAADAVHIHPLDITGALKILIAEVRAALPLPGDEPRPGDELRPELPVAPELPLPPELAIAPGSRAAPRFPAADLALLETLIEVVSEPTPATTPQTVVRLLLQAMPAPDSHEPAAWLAAANQVEAALQVALDGAVSAVAAWRDVPAAVVEGARDVRDVVVAAVTDDPPNPAWVRPEWVGLAPAMQRYWRRRRVARRRLTDPDPRWHELDDAVARDEATDRDEASGRDDAVRWDGVSARPQRNRR